MADEAHSLPFIDGWRIWRCALLRGAGFPAEMVLTLASSECASAALDSARATHAATEACIAASEKLVEVEGDRALCKAARKARARLRSGELPDNLEALGAYKSHLAEAIELSTKAETSAKRYAAAFADERIRTGRALAEVCDDPRFEEALVWQNREVASLVLPKLRDREATLNTKQRKRQRIAARYIQRYSVKNDSIGFFGPLNWAEFDASLDRITTQAGPELLGGRAVYFEHWALDQLATTLVEDPQIMPQLRPKLLASVRLEDSIVHYGPGQSTHVPAFAAHVLRACTGEATAGAIASQMLEDLGDEFDEPDEIFEVLQDLVDKKLITWDLGLPSGVLHPERRLEGLLEDLGREGEAALGMWRELKAAKAQVAASAGDAARLQKALGDLETLYAKIARGPTSRGAGQNYASRTLIYEDTLRDFQLQLGEPFREATATALAPVLASSRWYTHEIAKGYRLHAERCFDEARGSNTELSFQEFWKQLGPAFPSSANTKSDIIAAVADALADKWSALLGLDGDPEVRRVQWNSEEFTARAAGVFDAPAPGWPTARHMAPDLMLCASDAEALERGEFRTVLGEHHIGNTLLIPCAIQQHPEPEALIAWKDADLLDELVCPVQMRQFVARTDRVSFSSKGFALELGDSRSWLPDSRILRAADLIVRREARGLRVVDRKAGHNFDIILFLDQYLTFASSSNFALTKLDTYLPRVSVDDLVLVREQWRFQTEDVEFIHLKDEAEQFRACQLWAKSKGLPRWVFLRVPSEAKPMFLDFESPLLVSQARMALATNETMKLSEMLPDFDEVWLPDARGRRYSSELRCIFVDPCEWRAPQA